MTQELIVVDHEAEGSAKILSQYKNSPIFDVTLDTFTAKINELETEFTKFKSELQLDTALGVNLDLIGDILNSPVRPIGDEDYRKVLYALVVAYNSEGRASDILSLMSKVIDYDDINIVDYGLASFGIQVFNPSFPIDPAFIANSINIAKSAGVLYEGLVLVTDADPLFSFFEDDDPSAGGFELAPLEDAFSSTYVFPSSGPAAAHPKVWDISEAAGISVMSIAVNDDGDAFFNEMVDIYQQGLPASQYSSFRVKQSFNNFTFIPNMLTDHNTNPVITRDIFAGYYVVKISIGISANLLFLTDWWIGAVNYSDQYANLEAVFGGYTSAQEAAFDSANPSGPYVKWSGIPIFYSYRFPVPGDIGGTIARVHTSAPGPIQTITFETYADSYADDFISELQFLADNAGEQITIFDKNNTFGWVLISLGEGVTVTVQDILSPGVVGKTITLQLGADASPDSYNIASGTRTPTQFVAEFLDFESTDLEDYSRFNGAGFVKRAFSNTPLNTPLDDGSAGYLSIILT